jgi:GTP-binding protein EngB required for normal cell division
MQLIASCPSIHSRSIGAIGGGFSSGKSSFINSFITSSQLRLAEGIKPVTAIPSYVVCDEKSQVKGITYKGGVFDISLEMYKDISHEFLKSFPFNLNEIVVYTTVLCPVNKEYFNHLCIIDTPGYNAPSAGTAEHDTATAKTYIKDAQFLIWIIGLDTNGTIPSSDIAFLDDLDFGKPDGRLLYVIANKAEIKTQSDIEQILDNFEQTLDDMGIEYAGISAYSSKKKQLYGQRKIDIFEFLKAQNIPNQKIGYLSNLLEEVFGVYQKTIIKEHQDNKTKRKKVKAIILDAFEGGKIGPDKTPNKLEEGLNTLLHYFQPGQLEDSQKLVEAVLEKFQQCFLGFCDELGIDRSALPSKDPVSKSTKEAANEEKSKSGENDVEEAYKNLFGNGEGSLLEIIKQIKYVTTQIKRDIQF